MPSITHLAIYCTDLEGMRDFYMRFFNASSNERYLNIKKGFASYFLSFGESPVRLELMTKLTVTDGGGGQEIERLGLTHMAIQLASAKAVNELTELLRERGFTIAGEPRTTGDGYYESVVLDPEGNRLELVG